MRENTFESRSTPTWVQYVGLLTSVLDVLLSFGFSTSVVSQLNGHPLVYFARVDSYMNIQVFVFVVVGICSFIFYIIFIPTCSGQFWKAPSYLNSLQIIKYFPWCITPRLFIQFKSDGQVLSLTWNLCGDMFFSASRSPVLSTWFFSSDCQHVLSIFFCVQISHAKVWKHSWLQWSFGPNILQ